MRVCLGDERHSHVAGGERGPAWCVGDVMPWEIDAINDNLDETFGASHEA